MSPIFHMKNNGQRSECWTCPLFKFYLYLNWHHSLDFLQYVSWIILVRIVFFFCPLLKIVTQNWWRLRHCLVWNFVPKSCAKSSTCVTLKRSDQSSHKFEWKTKDKEGFPKIRHWLFCFHLFLDPFQKLDFSKDFPIWVRLKTGWYFQDWKRS